MYEDRKARATETWHSLMDKSEIRLTVQVQNGALLRLPENYLKQGFISREERESVVIQATKRYATSCGMMRWRGNQGFEKKLRAVDARDGFTSAGL
jgi:hypothetical protein